MAGIWLPMCLLVALASRAEAVDRITFQQDGRLHSVSGEILVRAQDGGALLMGRDGQLWSVQPDEITREESNEAPFEPVQDAELKRSLSRELPGFKFHRTAHFLIAYNTSPAYAQWCGGLYERLYRAFVNFWSRRGVALVEPRFPLVAIAFASQSDYADYARDELGGTAGGIIGYYSLKTNRVAMYDLTGVEGMHSGTERLSNAKLINRVLSQPTAVPNVATLIHEATHQVAYNVGLQTRYADNPLWLSEGLAVYFETPDLGSSKGWRGIGRVNARRLTQLRRYLPARPTNSLKTLLTSDDRLRESTTAADAYAEAWGLCYFLLKRREPAFVDYVQALSELEPLKNVPAEDRLDIFQQHFGNLTDLDRRFVNEMQSLRLR